MYLFLYLLLECIGNLSYVTKWCCTQGYFFKLDACNFFSSLHPESTTFNVLCLLLICYCLQHFCSFAFSLFLLSLHSSLLNMCDEFLISAFPFFFICTCIDATWMLFKYASPCCFFFYILLVI